MKYLKKYSNREECVGTVVDMPAAICVRGEKPCFLGKKGVKSSEILMGGGGPEGEYASYVKATYNITNTTGTTKILYTVTGVRKMIIDGNEVPLSTSYLIISKSGMDLYSYRYGGANVKE